MADQRTMEELLRARTEGYAEAIVVPLILAEQFELKHSLINMMTSDQFFGLEKDNPHDHICWFNKITTTIKYKDVPNSLIKLMKDLLCACPYHGFTELHKLDTFYNALNPADQDSLNSATVGNLLERRTQDVLMIIENKSKVRNSRNKSIVFQVKSSDANSSSSSKIAKLTHAVNQQTSDVTTTMTAILKQFQATPLPAFVKAVEEICVTCGGAHPGLEKIKRVNEANMKAMQTQINNVKNELRNEMKNSIQASMSNQTNKLKNVMASFFQMNTASTSSSGSLPRNTIANPKGKLKAITTRSGIVLDGPFVPIPPPFINPEEDECVEETLMDQDLAEYTIKVPPSLKMLKALFSNKEKLLELANMPLNENCSTVILKKLPEKLGERGKFLIPCGFSELKCKALADLANQAIYMPARIARDVFVPVGKFTFPADFVIVDYESDLRVPFILGRPFLRTARALNYIHGEEMILQSINMINIYDDSSEDFLEELFTINHQSGNPTFSSHPKLTSPEVKDDPEGGNVLIEKLLYLDSTKDPHEKLLNIKLFFAKIKSFNDNPTPDHVLKPFSSSPIPVEDIDSFLEKSDTSLSFSNNSLPEYETFGKLTSVVMKDNLAEPRVHVPNVLTTHPTLMPDTDFIPFDNSLPEYEIFYFDIEEKNSGSTTIHADISLLDLECFNFNDKPDPGELTSIVDFGIRENIPSATNVNLPPEKDHSPLFAYVVWIFLSFLTYPVVPPNLLSSGMKIPFLNPTALIIISLLYCRMYIIGVKLL
uniref:Reverse transcriptase domain-containing protein n=1 Tax=Tanacetum cinerariifolium TaxID=118510 RepID=A0A6L2J4M9_TANCI|nr:hypothetical protein [Tanacetum cinerariifolium]